MPVLPQAFWYNVDGKLKQVFFEEAKIPKEKRDALLKHLQRTRNYGAGSPPVQDEQQSSQNASREKEKLYGWYPPAPGAQYMSVAQARLDQRVFKPNDWRAAAVVPDDRTRVPISTQINADGVAPCIPPFATDPMAYKYSAENTTEVPTAKAPADFMRWEKEESGRIPQWNDVVSFHGMPTLPERSRTVAVVELDSKASAPVAEDGIKFSETLAPPEQKTRPLSQPVAAVKASKSPIPPVGVQTQPVRRGSARASGITVEATPINASSSLAMPSSSSFYNNNNNKRNNGTPEAQTSLTLHEIQEMQKKLSTDYRWRFHVHGDPFAVKSKARPGRPAHWMQAKAEAPKQVERHVHYSDSTTFFYNTIPIIPLSFSVGQGLLSEKVIRDREAKQKFAPKSTPNDRYFIPAFIY